MKATVTSKGQITIPSAVRRKLKLVKGSVLEFDLAADHLKATSSPLENRCESEDEDSGARARRETGSKVVTFVEDFATRPWCLKTVCSPRPVFQRAAQAGDRASMRSVIGIARDRLRDKTIDQLLDEVRGPVELPKRS